MLIINEKYWIVFKRIQIMKPFTLWFGTLWNNTWNVIEQNLIFDIFIPFWLNKSFMNPHLNLDTDLAYKFSVAFVVK